MGHQHAKPATQIPYVLTTVDADDNPIQHEIDRYLVGTGGFLKGYELGTKDPLGHPSGSYIEKAMLSPVTLGGPMLYIRPRFSKGMPDPSIRVSV